MARESRTPKRSRRPDDARRLKENIVRILMEIFVGPPGANVYEVLHCISALACEWCFLFQELGCQENVASKRRGQSPDEGGRL